MYEKTMKDNKTKKAIFVKKIHADTYVCWMLIKLRITINERRATNNEQQISLEFENVLYLFISFPSTLFFCFD